MRKDFLVFGNPHIEEDEIKEVVDCLRSGWISTGPRFAQFEELFKKYIGAKHALALNSCTAGLHLSMIVAGLKPGDEVITTPMTFAATANAILHTGATPVFVDVELPSMTIDPGVIENKITSKTKAILPCICAAGRVIWTASWQLQKHNLWSLMTRPMPLRLIIKGKRSAPSET